MTAGHEHVVQRRGQERPRQAAGVAAALASSAGVAPGALDVGEIQDALRAQGAYLSTAAARAG